MKILPPYKITSEIIEIISEAKEYLIIVSPYVDFLNWDLMITSLNSAMKRGVKIYFFIRHEVNNVKSWEQVQELGIEPKLVSNLHAKFYMNEKNAVISSLNLISKSSSNNIEIGSKLENENEIEELKSFVKNYIQPNIIDEIPDEDDLYLSKEKYTIILENYIGSVLELRTKVYVKNGNIIISAGRQQFTLFIDKVTNTIGLISILSGVQAKNYDIFGSEFFESDYFTFSINMGGENTYDTLIAVSSKRLSNYNLNYLRVNEKKQTIHEISLVIEQVLEYKSDNRHRSQS